MRGPKHLLTLIIGAALALAALFAAGHWFAAKRSVHQRDTDNLRGPISLGNLCKAVDAFEVDNNHVPRLWLYGNIMTYNSNLVAILTGSTSSAAARAENPSFQVYLTPTPDSCRQGVWVDPWGNPYHVALDENGDGKVRVGETHVLSEMVIWTAGANGINEFGRGDDIMYGCSHEGGRGLFCGGPIPWADE
jgi:hypothetical protein